MNANLFNIMNVGGEETNLFLTVRISVNFSQSKNVNLSLIILIIVFTYFNLEYCHR